MGSIMGRKNIIGSDYGSNISASIHVGRNKGVCQHRKEGSTHSLMHIDIIINQFFFIIGLFVTI